MGGPHNKVAGREEGGAYDGKGTYMVLWQVWAMAMGVTKVGRRLISLLGRERGAHAGRVEMD